MANTFNTYLKLLAYINFSFVFFCFVEALIDFVDFKNFVGFGLNVRRNPIHDMIWPYILHPLREVWWVASAYMTMALSIERLWWALL